jgi:hypothetical protein
MDNEAMGKFIRRLSESELPEEEYQWNLVVKQPIANDKVAQVARWTKTGDECYRGKGPTIWAALEALAAKMEAQ